MSSNLHSSLLFLLILSTINTVAHISKHALVSFFLIQQLSVSAVDPVADLIQRNDYWLPDDVEPVNYNLSLLVNMEEFTTEGEVKIRLKVKKATDKITFHASHHIHRRIVTVQKENVKVYQNTKTIPIKQQDYEKRMFYTIKLNNRVRKGSKLTLVIPFSGKIKQSGEGRGFYSSPDGAGGQMAVTQFQAMWARTAFPCFDEPRQSSPKLISNLYLVKTLFKGRHQ